uniref:Uncharacterized protein n=1 Tax=Rhizophora mucronata TaxID=61149 RepID=A0A2P2JTY6_RHIMU
MLPCSSAWMLGSRCALVYNWFKSLIFPFPL